MLNKERLQQINIELQHFEDKLELLMRSNMTLTPRDMWYYIGLREEFEELQGLQVMTCYELTLEDIDTKYCNSGGR